MKLFLAVLLGSFAGTAVNVWWLSGFIPWFLLPDYSFLAIVFSGLFLSGPVGFLAALAPALFREMTVSAPPWTIFFGSMALFFLAREMALRVFVRTESFVLAVVAGLLLLESVSIVTLLLMAGSRPFSVLWGAKEAVRIAWTSLLAVPIFMDLSDRWRRVRE